jgi:GTP cyclohydrolase I
MNDPKLNNATLASERIHARLAAAGRRFHANDNIADFIEQDELRDLEDEVTAQMQGLLETLVIDTHSDHNTRGTARRVARMFLHEVFRGRYHPMPPVTEFPNAERLNELMIIGPITVRSACSHHLVPISASCGSACCRASSRTSSACRSIRASPTGS